MRHLPVEYAEGAEPGVMPGLIGAPTQAASELSRMPPSSAKKLLQFSQSFRPSSIFRLPTKIGQLPYLLAHPVCCFFPTGLHHDRLRLQLELFSDLQGRPANNQDFLRPQRWHDGRLFLSPCLRIYGAYAIAKPIFPCSTDAGTAADATSNFIQPSVGGRKLYS